MAIFSRTAFICVCLSARSYSTNKLHTSHKKIPNDLFERQRTAKKATKSKKKKYE